MITVRGLVNAPLTMVWLEVPVDSCTTFGRLLYEGMDSFVRVSVPKRHNAPTTHHSTTIVLFITVNSFVCTTSYLLYLLCRVLNYEFLCLYNICCNLYKSCL